MDSRSLLSNKLDKKTAMDESFILFSFMSLLFLSSMFPISPTSAFNSTHLPLCHDDERSALLQFKESFIIDKDRASSDDPFAYSKVKSWKLNGAAYDCCSWDGVECDHLTGHVIGLDLSSSCLYGSINSSSSLFRLVHLRKLNLAFNHFNYSQIPPAIGLLSKLVYLNMSSSFLSGPIPFNVSDLSSLSSLVLSLNYELSFQASNFRHLVNNLTRRLEVLGLSGVDISSTVPAILANSSSLSFLNLKNCGLYGEFPSEIFHLSKLEVLNLGSNKNLRGYLPEFHSSSPLRILRLKSTGFSGKISESIGNLDFLTILDLSGVDISSTVPAILANSSSLSSLILKNCGLYGEFPVEIFHLLKLEVLNLGFNKNLRGYLPEFHSSSPLRILRLPSTSFSGDIPGSIGNLNSLTILNLGNCIFSGKLSSSFGNLTNLSYLFLSNNAFDRQQTSSLSWLGRLTKLVKLGFAKANLYGEFPSFFANLTQLSSLILRQNKLKGPFPTSLINLTDLTSLDLYGNGLQGSIPKSISQLRNLEFLSLGRNSFSGTLEWDIFLKLEKLQHIILSFNNLTLVINTSSNNTFQKFLSIGFGGCKLDLFPDFLRYQDKLEYLDLSENSIAGQIPKWLWNGTNSLQIIDFSLNFLTGFEAHPIVLSWVKATDIFLESNMLQSSPPLPPALIETYVVSSNKLTGKIPLSFCNLTSLHVLHMEDNQLSGRLPSCLGNFSTNLKSLNLGKNNFYGKIPLTFSSESNLRMIKLGYNQLQGEVPRSLSNCTKLEFLDIGNNQIRDVFPSWLGPLPNLKVLILRSNQFLGVLTGTTAEFDFQKLSIIDLSRNNFTGQLPTQYFFNWVAMKAVDEDQLTYMAAPGRDNSIDDFLYSMLITSKGTERKFERILEYFVAVDLSCNRFEGDIPGVIGSLQGLRQLNLSHNNLSGDIPSTLANLTRLESLDLSQNKLSGAIPQQLAQLNSLAVFNVSHNLLAGPIPRGDQFDTFQNDSYQENLGLCGNPLSRKCGNSEATPRLPLGPDDEEDSSSLLEFGWEPVAIGYGSGLVFGLVIGYIVVTRHFEWFAGVLRVRVKRTKRARNRRARN